MRWLVRRLRSEVLFIARWQSSLRSANCETTKILEANATLTLARSQNGN